MAETSTPDLSDAGSARRPLGGRALLVASTGGHLAELVRLAPQLGVSDESVWVTPRTPQSTSLLEGRRVHHVAHVRSRDLLGAARAGADVARLLRGERFDLAVSTGAALAVTVLPVARALGVRCLYVESVCRVDGPSLSGRLLAASRLVELQTQHAAWARGRWAAVPGVLSTYRAVRGEPVDRPRLFVTLGTNRSYRFDALVDAVLATGLTDASTVWQLGCTDRRDLPGRTVTEMTTSEFTHAVSTADVVIAHAGVGSLLALLEAGVRPVLVPRRRSRHEHVDDHQQQIAGSAAADGVACGVQVAEMTAAVLRGASGWSVVDAPEALDEAQPVPA